MLLPEPAPNENFELFPDIHLPPERRSQKVNADVPQYRDLKEERRLLLISLEVLYKRIQTSPICLVEHKDCFTNSSMRDTLTKLLGGVRNFNKYVIVHSIDPTVYEYPFPDENRIYILGGSVSDTYDRFGHDFTRRFSLPLIEAVAKTSTMRVLSVCFGYQSLAEAYGNFVGVPLRTLKESEQFGYYPIDFEFDAHSAVKSLVAGLPKSAVFTRSGYPQTADMRPVTSIQGIHTLASFAGDLKFGPHSSHYLPPGVSYLTDASTGSDKMIGVQFHPEIQSTRKHIEPILSFMNTLQTVDTRSSSLNSCLSKVRRSIAHAFMTSVLGTFAKEISFQ
jgi:GMP synthase-like glutamine amidotransferase